MAHTQRDQRKLLNRTSRIRGQVDAIEKALTNGADCSLILQTVTACRGAMNGLMTEIFEGHLRHPVLDPECDSTDDLEAAADEVIKLVRTYLTQPQSRSRTRFMRILMRQSLAIVLSAAVLATAMLPPAVCHMHQGGDVQHAHSAADTHAHAHHSDSHAATHHASDDCGHSHERTADHVSKPADDHAHGLEPAVAHRHLLIAGFEFTIPQPAGDGPRHGDGDSSSDRIAVKRLTDDAVVVQSVEPASPFELAACFDGHIAELSDVNRPTLRSLLEPAGDRFLLCDSARFERSGVLLI